MKELCKIWAEKVKQMELEILLECQEAQTGRLSGDRDRLGKVSICKLDEINWWRLGCELGIGFEIYSDPIEFA